MGAEDYTLDEPFPSKRLVKQVLWQVWGSDYHSPKEISEAWCLRDLMSCIDDASRNKLKILHEHFINNKLIEETGEPDYYRPTRKGQDVLNGEDYETVGPTAKTEPSVVLIDVDENFPDSFFDEMLEPNKTFGEAGRWKPLYADELAIVDMTPEHIINAILWVDKKMTQIVALDSSHWKYLCYLVGSV